MSAAQAQGQKIYYSPSLEIVCTDTSEAVSISAVENEAGYECYIFYKRPKRVKKFFGLQQKLVKEYITDKTGLTTQDAIDCLNALIKGDSEYLADKIGK